MKSLLRLVLSIVLSTILLCFSTTALAVLKTSGSWHYLGWTLDDAGTLTISVLLNGNGYMTDFTTDSREAWHYQYSWEEIQNVVIKAGVKNISANAFLGLRELKSVTIPSTVTNIGDNAFRNCRLRSVTIPEGVTSIGNNAFFGCEELTNVTIPSTVTSISDNAFSGCSSLKSVTIPEGVTSIGNNAFLNCSCLTNITIPSSVTSIGNKAFSGCSSLTSVQISEGVTSIGEQAFSRCGRLTSVTIPEGVTSIEDRTFYGCALQSVTIPSTVTAIHSEAFLGNSKLTSAGPIGNGYSVQFQWTDTIPGNVFRSFNLTNVTIPENIASIDDEAFNGCSGLTKITVDPANALFCDQNGVLFNKNMKMLICIPAGIKGTYEIPEGVTIIGDYAFRGCNGLTSVTVPSSIPTISDYAFYDCSGLTDVTIRNGVVSIGDKAFLDCVCLKNVSIPSSVTVIGEDAFNGCSSLTSITVDSENSSYCDQDGVLFDKNMKTIVRFPAGKDGAYEIPEGVTVVETFAFFDCKVLTSVIMPSDVARIGGSAFYNCSSLTDIYYCGSKEQWSTLIIGDNNEPLLKAAIHFSDIIAYGICGTEGDGLSWTLYNEGVLVISGKGDMLDFASDSTDQWLFHKSEIKSVVIEFGVTSLGNAAFSGCSSLVNVTIPSSVTSLGGAAFSDCNSLMTVTIPSSVTSLGSAAFSGCSNLASISIPSGIDTIGASTFYGCSSLTDVSISDGLTGIGDYAFCNCSGLKQVTIPEGVISIGNWAFSDCTKLTSITIPVSVTRIGNYAFSFCSSLANVYFQGTQTQWGAISKENSGLNDNIVHFNSGVLYTISYNANGGMDAPESHKKPYDEAVSLSSEIPIKDGYLFLGWATESDATAPKYQPGDSFIENVNITLYAVWIAPDFILPNALSIIEEEAFNGGLFAFVKLSDHVVDIQKRAFADCSNLKYIYIPQTTTSIHDNAFENDTDLTIIGKKDSFAENYAENHNYRFIDTTFWQKRYKVSYDANGGSGVPGVQSKLQDEDLILSLIQPVRADSTRGYYTIALDANGGVSPGTLNATVTESYQFINWNTEPDGSGVSYESGSSYTNNEAITLYAQWNGTLSATAVELPRLTREGYQFRGWSENAGDSSGIMDKYVPSGNVTLYAVWEAQTYIVSYNANGGSGAPLRQTKKHDIDLVLSSNVPVRTERTESYTVTLNANGGTVNQASLSVNSVTSYDFESWNTKYNGNGTYYSPASCYSDNASVTLYAQWNAVTSTDTVELPDATRDGYTFKGWSEYSTGSAAFSGSYTPSGNVTLYAVWEISGTWGENLNWVLDQGVLTISGVGEMNNLGADWHASQDVSTKAWLTYRDSISSVIIEEGVESIGNDAFYHCSNLAEVTIPDSVTKIGNYAFRKCVNLTHISLPESIRKIGSEAFFGCTQLSSIDIPSSLEIIDYGAFAYCESLTDIIIPTSVTSIGSYAFSSCYMLQEILIPEGITIISQYLFSDCRSLRSITIPASVESIGSSPFHGCDNLTAINVEEGNLAYCDVYGVLFNQNKTQLIAYPAGKTGSYAIPAGVTSIGASAFLGCKGLTGITFPSTVSEIGYSSFENCTALTSIIIPSSITEISSFSFCNCSNLKSVTIPVSVTSIRQCAFYDCNKLAHVYYKGTQSQWKAINIESDNDPFMSATKHYNAS